MTAAGSSKPRTRIVILGGGFGGMYAALEFDRGIARDDDVEVTLINEDNFFLFTPMLHEVAASDVDVTHIVNPIRKMLRHVAFLEAKLEGIDRIGKKVSISYGLGRYRRELPYDHLILALGSESNFFGKKELEDNAVTMKSLGDAVFLRNRMIALLEMACVERDPDVRNRMLTFVVAGGGFAGVETIGAMNDFLREATDYYKQLESHHVRVVLVHPGKWLLPELGEKLGRYTEKKMRARNIEIFTETKVIGYQNHMVMMDKGEPIPASTLVWTAGVTPAMVIQSIPTKQERGRLVTDEFLEIPELANVWAVGDCAAIPNLREPGKYYPGTAQHALREGARAAKNISAVLRGKEKKAFVYRNQGQLATIGRRTGVANVYGVEFSGFMAWWFWRTVYLSKLPRLEKKIRVALDWTLDMFFTKDLAQYITLHDVQAFAHLINSETGGRMAGATGSQSAMPHSPAGPAAPFGRPPGKDGQAEVHPAAASTAVSATVAGLVSNP